jgi:hypothetical protein
MKKNRLKFCKNRPVRFGFGFISLKPKKLNRTQTEPNLCEPVFVLKIEAKPIGLNRFGSVSVFFLISVWLLFFYKNRTEPKIITPSHSHHNHWLEIKME